MSSVPGPFAPPSERDVTRLVLDHPLAWLVTMGGGEYGATPLPLRPVIGENGEVVELLGHFARSNPHHELARRVRPTLVLFSGPQGYVSSSWFRDRTRFPTWNYAYVQYLVDIEYTEDPVETERILRDLVDAMERDRPNAWSIEDGGPRYAQLVRGIIAFHARILDRRVKFKLAQDERDGEFADIVQALDATGQHGLLEWTQRCNTARAR
jgi:predicted FMN-binding regulatory protein PaiB